eukprot:359040-Chlamydomonas_euryale.AAC.2
MTLAETSCTAPSAPCHSVQVTLSAASAPCLATRALHPQQASGDRQRNRKQGEHLCFPGIGRENNGAEQEGLRPLPPGIGRDNGGTEREVHCSLRAGQPCKRCCVLGGRKERVVVYSRGRFLHSVRVDHGVLGSKWLLLLGCCCCINDVECSRPPDVARLLRPSSMPREDGGGGGGRSDCADAQVHAPLPPPPTSPPLLPVDAGLAAPMPRPCCFVSGRAGPEPYPDSIGTFVPVPLGSLSGPGSVASPALVTFASAAVAVAERRRRQTQKQSTDSSAAAATHATTMAAMYPADIWRTTCTAGGPSDGAGAAGAAADGPSSDSTARGPPTCTASGGPGREPPPAPPPPPACTASGGPRAGPSPPLPPLAPLSAPIGAPPSGCVSPAPLLSSGTPPVARSGPPAGCVRRGRVACSSGTSGTVPLALSKYVGSLTAGVATWRWAVGIQWEGCDARNRVGAVVSDRNRVGAVVSDRNRVGAVVSDRNRVGPMVSDRNRAGAVLSDRNRVGG